MGYFRTVNSRFFSTNGHGFRHSKVAPALNGKGVMTRHSPHAYFPQPFDFKLDLATSLYGLVRAKASGITADALRRALTSYPPAVECVACVTHDEYRVHMHPSPLTQADTLARGSSRAVPFGRAPAPEVPREVAATVTSLAVPMRMGDCATVVVRRQAPTQFVASVVLHYPPETACSPDETLVRWARYISHVAIFAVQTAISDGEIEPGETVYFETSTRPRTGRPS